MRGSHQETRGYTLFPSDPFADKLLYAHGSDPCGPSTGSQQGSYVRPDGLYWVLPLNSQNKGVVTYTTLELGSQYITGTGVTSG